MARYEADIVLEQVLSQVLGMVLSKKDEIFGQDQCAKGVDLVFRGFTRSVS